MTYFDDRGEEIDIIDLNKNLLSQSTKAKAHRFGLLHKTVVASLIDSKKRWLLVEQSGSKQDGGKLVFPVGGHVKKSEGVENALRRETLEEVGITNFKYKFIGEGIYNRLVKKSKENHFFSYFEIYSDAIPILGKESIKYKYFSSKQLQKLLKQDSEYIGDSLKNLLIKFYPLFNYP